MMQIFMPRYWLGR